jgi:hypothetical protein
MNNEDVKENEILYEFVWNGGFSYLTYLKIETQASLIDQKLIISTQSFVLGAFPLRKKITELSLDHIRTLSTGSKINWFDLIFSILFILLTLISMSFWPLVPTVLFLLRTFNTSIFITDHLANKISIPTNAKDAAIQFVRRIAYVIHEQTEATHSAGLSPQNRISPPIIPTTESHTMKTVFLVISAAIIAISILFVGIYSRGGFDNQNIKSVREGKVPGSDLSMSQVLENKKYFSNVEWKQVEYSKNDLDHYVMYQATYSDQGVKVFVRTVFQVFGKDHFQALETSVDGQPLELSDWQDLLTSLILKDNNTAAATKAVPKPTENKPQPKAAPVQEPIKQPNNAPVPATKAPNPDSKVVLLKDFVKWSPSIVDAILPLKLDGEKMNLVVGYETQSGMKLQLQDRTKKWNLRLKGGSNAFNSYGDLNEGFNLYVKDHNFDVEPTPEVVVVASNGLMETYVWVFAYNFVYYEKSGTAPLEQIWFGEGQSNVILNGNEIVLPFGSQGLSETYVYENLTFQKKQR